MNNIKVNLHHYSFMLKGLPQDGISLDNIRGYLDQFSRGDMSDESGRLFSYIYESGRADLEKMKEFYLEFMNKNALDFTVFPSSLKLENDIVAMTGSLLNGDSSVVGNFTSGGTESIMLAVKTARDYFISKNGKSSTKPELIMPNTAHPAFVKAAHYFSLELKIVPVNRKTYKVEQSEVINAVTDRTAMIVGSAPSYPTGIIDSIEELGDIAGDNNLWLHVDACLGGFILPFLKLLGQDIPDFDFSVKGVNSMSVDLHKYGYTPKGASVVLYRNRDLRIHQLFTNASWPGYPIANTTLQSTRSTGPQAAAWATLNYLGVKGYRQLATKVMSARAKLMTGLKELGYETLGNPQASVVAFQNDNIDIFALADLMKNDGWYIQVQPGSEELGYAASLHMTLTAAHDDSISGFLDSLRKNTRILEEGGNSENHTDSISEFGNLSSEDLNTFTGFIAQALSGADQGDSFSMSTINRLIRTMPHDIVETLFREIVNQVFTPTFQEENTGEKP